MTEVLMITRVANGWVVRAGMQAADEFAHVYASPEELAAHVKRWADISQDMKENKT